MLPLILFFLTCLVMIAAVLYFPKLHLGRLTLDSYWVVTVLGALLLLLCGPASLSEVTAELVADSAVNPVKILVLFLSMTLLSVFLDELGFFRYMAMAVLRSAVSVCFSQMMLCSEAQTVPKSKVLDFRMHANAAFKSAL